MCKLFIIKYFEYVIKYFLFALIAVKVKLWNDCGNISNLNQLLCYAHTVLLTFSLPEGGRMISYTHCIMFWVHHCSSSRSRSCDHCCRQTRRRAWQRAGSTLSTFKCSTYNWVIQFLHLQVWFCLIKFTGTLIIILRVDLQR